MLVTVSYADIDGVVDIGSLGVTDIVVTGPGGPLTVTGVAVSPLGAGTPRTAIYAVAAPGGTWDPTDNGVYTVALAASEVFDGNSLAAAAVASLASFTVAAPVAPSPASFRVEAEDFTLVAGFAVKARGAASGGANIEALGFKGEAVAALVFTGPDGFYDLALGHFDENDGAASMQVLVNGVEIDSFAWNTDTGFSKPAAGALVERTIAGATLVPGDKIELKGTRAPGEPVRTDYLDFTPIDSAPPAPFRVEAEDFTLGAGFAVRARGAASGGANIEALGFEGEAVAALVFTGPDGFYDLALGHFDENDGVARTRLLVNGAEIVAFDWDSDLGSDRATAQALTERLFEDVALEAGDVIELRGTRAPGEPLRTDYLDFAWSGEFFG